ncbi:MAG TPA: hypothetical protein V6D48_20155 [Oculatellaceae cyanobacterium]
MLHRRLPLLWTLIKPAKNGTVICSSVIHGSIVGQISYLHPDMEIHQAIRLNYTRISQSIQAELSFLSELSKIADDERFRQSIAEVIYSLNDLSDTLDLQRRYLNPRSNGK